MDKPGLVRNGRTLLDIAVAAVAPARTVVVGPHRELPPGLLQTRENPPGGGPAAALVAGLELLATAVAPAEGNGAGPGGELIAVVAADLPGIDPSAFADLAAAVVAAALDGAVLVDRHGRSQYLAGVWNRHALLRAARLRPSWHGVRLSDLLEPLIGARLPADPSVSADLDTPADLLEWNIDRPEGPPGHDALRSDGPGDPAR